MKAARREPLWTPSGAPAWRRELVAQHERLVTRWERLAQQGHSLEGLSVARMRDMSATCQMAARHLATAGLFWVTRDMAQVALDASIDVPSFSVDNPPATHGVMLFQDPLPPLPTRAVGGLTLWPRGADAGPAFTDFDPVPVDGIAWLRQGEHIQVIALVRAHRLPGLLDRQGAALVNFLSATVPVRTEALENLCDPAGHPIAQPYRALLALLISAWELMQIPTLAERRSLDAGTGRGATSRTSKDRLVTTIDLRPLRQVTTSDGETDSQGRVYRHRWVVRGHWTHQPCGPGRAERKLIYREPYVKGPAGAPLLDTEKVMVWRR